MGSLHLAYTIPKIYIKLKDFIHPAMEHMEPEELERTRRNLLKYCELDTLAMVKIWERLKEVSKE